MKTILLLTLAASAFAQDYTLSVQVNPINVSVGQPLWVALDIAFMSTSNNYDLSYVTSDPSIAAATWCNVANPTCWGLNHVFFTGTSPAFYVVITPSPTAHAGNYTVTVTANAAGVIHALTLPVNVRSPVLAGLPAFEANMIDVTPVATSIARCDPATPNAIMWAFGTEGQAWYYDGGYVYYNIADYTKDPKWKGCAVSILNAYRDYAIAGGVPGWRVFTQGLRRAFQETGDVSYKNAVNALMTTSSYSGSGGAVTDEFNRETAYMLRCYTDAHLLGLTTDPAAVSRSLNWILGDVEVLFSNSPATSLARTHQVFMDGLMAEALTYYYDNWTPDPRIPPAIKKMCDWLWQYGWRDDIGRMVWNPFPYKVDYPRQCIDVNECQTYADVDTLLYNLELPAFWWYAKISGDYTYQRMGDRIFSQGQNLAPYKGKEFSQMYHWAIPALAWRK